jgi:hypothetical protein
MSYTGQIQKMMAEIGPYYLHNLEIGGFLESTGKVLDDSIQSLTLGLRLGYPLRCDVTALPYLSNDRQIRLYPSESIASQRYRLTQWKQLHRQRGSHIGEMKHEQPYFLPDVPMMRVVHQSGTTVGSVEIATWHTLDSDGVYSKLQRSPSNWNWDNTPSKWSRFWVILYAPSSFMKIPKYGEGHKYGDGTRYASASTRQISRDLVDMILEWKATWSRCSGVILATDPASFDPTQDSVPSGFGWTSLPAGNWGQPIDSSGTRTRLPTAVWLFDQRNL